MNSRKECLKIINFIEEKKLNTNKNFYILIKIISKSFIFFFCLGFISCYALIYILYTNKQNKKLLYIQSFEDEPITKNVNFTFLKMIDKIFKENNKVNINKVESKIKSSKQNNIEPIKSKIHIAFTLDPDYVLETMLTLSSIMDTQNKTTKIIFHLGVINNFKAKKMLKIYQLKERINNLTEFNFYYLEGAMKKMKNFHPKGEACPGKFELPELLPDDVERILLFDAGDVLVFRDLTELYNYDMKDYWVLGIPEPSCIEPFVKIYNIKKYINIGSILINVKKLKQNNFWEIYTKNRYLKLGGAVDQTLFNIVVPDDKKGFFPFRFGGYTILRNNNESDNLRFHDYGLQNWLKSNLSSSMPEKPETLFKLISQLYNSLFIHQFCYKWYEGDGLSIYRNLVKYYIKLAGIWKELCNKKIGYCI